MTTAQSKGYDEQRSMEMIGRHSGLGNGFVMGITENSGQAIQVVWLADEKAGMKDRSLTAASDTSNEGFDHIIKTEFPNDPTDEKIDKTPNDLPVDDISYPVMLSRGNLHVISNGTQTGDIMDSIANTHSMWHAMYGWEYNKSELLYSSMPRIAGALAILPHDWTWYGNGMIIPADMNITSRSAEIVSSEGTFNLPKGLALGNHDGSRSGSPSKSVGVLPIGEGAEDTLEMYKKALASQNVSALAVKGIDIVSGEVSTVIANQP